MRKKVIKQAKDFSYYQKSKEIVPLHPCHLFQEYQKIKAQFDSELISSTIFYLHG